MTSLKPAAKGILWNSIGKLVEYVVLYAISILVARGLGLYANGTYATLMSLTQILLVLASMGLETSLNRFIPQFEPGSEGAGVRFLLTRAILVRLAGFVVAGAALTLVAHAFPERLPQGARDYLWILLVYAGVRSVVPLVSIALTARFRTDIVAGVGVGTRLVELVGVLILSRTGLEIGSLLGLFAATGTGQLVLYAVVARRAVPGPSLPQPVRPFLMFGLVFWVNALVDYFLGRHGDVILLTALTGDPAQASVYDVAFSVVQLASLALTLGFGGVTFATFAALAMGNPKEMERFYAFLVRLISSLTIPLYAFLVFNSAPVVHVLYSPAFEGAVALVQGIAWFRIASRLFGGGENTEYLLARGFPGRVSTVGIVVAGVNIVLDVLLIPGLGAAGAVLGSGIANLLANAAGWILVRRRAAVHIQFVAWTKVTGIAVLFSWFISIMVPPTDPGSLAASGGLFIGGMIVGLMVVRPFTVHDVAMLGSVSRTLARALRMFASRG